MTNNNDGQEFYWMKDATIPGLVAALGGVGLVGLDVTTEQDMTGLSQNPVSEISNMRYCFAGRTESKSSFWSKLQNKQQIGVLTSYPNAAQKILRGFPVTTFYLAGSVEAMPKALLGVDTIFDIVRTGQTLADNGLEIFYDVGKPIPLMLVQRDDSVTIEGRKG